MAGIPERAGYDEKGRRWLLTRSCPRPEAALHRTDHFLHLLEFLGIPGQGREPDFRPRPEAQAELDELLESHGIVKNAAYAVVHPGGNWSLKRWPVPYFIEWIELFLKKYQAHVILCGTLPEAALSEKISSHFKNGRVISFCGKTSTVTLALLLKNAQFLLSNDSGPIHLAASQGTNIIGLFGPTSPELTGPISKGRTVILRKEVGCEIPCYYRSCDTRVCMEWLKPAEVFEASVKVMDGK